MLQRLLIEKMENRILVGITMFVGIMILVGWVAIKEPARMSSFDRQFLARSIERGGEQFALKCVTCHGPEGHGIGGRAPGLNNPHLFGYNFFADLDTELDDLDSSRAQLETERTNLAEELVAEDTTDERKEEIQARIVEISEEMDALDAQLQPIMEERQAIIDQLQPAILKGYPITTDADGNVQINTSRLEQVEFGGSLAQYITVTLHSGRPGSNSYWPAPMVSWSQDGGGPLRDDQVQDIVNYILNWDKGDDWTIQDALAVEQYAVWPLSPGTGSAGTEAEVAGTDVEAVLAQIESETIVGDPDYGQQLYMSQVAVATGGVLGCNGCHVGGVSAPPTAGTFDRVQNERLQQPQFADYTPEHYLIESILQPEAYVVPGWSGGIMPNNFGSRLSVQELADIVAFLETQVTAE
jgi:mono/diheme cytochrome c family protein